MPGTTDSESKSNDASMDSKASLPYPVFSKAHSKESVGSREAFRPVLNVITPPSTDVNVSKEKINSGPPRSSPIRNPPPSPPLTDNTSEQPHKIARRSPEVETLIEDDGRKSSQETLTKPQRREEIPKAKAHVRVQNPESAAITSPMKLKPRSETPVQNINEEPRKPLRTTSQPSVNFTRAPLNSTPVAITQTSSNATSIAPEQPNIQRPGSKLLPTAQYKTQISPIQEVSPQQQPLEAFLENDRYPSSTPGHLSMPPPPPPPPPDLPLSAPKVDYLLQHGGLHQAVPKNLLLAGKPMAIQQAVQSPGHPPAVIANLFEPYNTLLSDYEKVMTKNGSLAVATGYRSVARRLLDRLEAVFARDISSETCRCCMCFQSNAENEDIRGVNWGEILELVSGRRDLPNWSPFSIVQSPSGLGISLENMTPMQELDSDIPEEFREHYIRQSRKTKQSVDRWLHRQVITASNLPEEVDDETLTFAILTYLSPEQRPIFNNLMGIVQGPLEPPRRAPSPERDPRAQQNASVPPAPRIRPKALEIARLAIQRLYRLGQPPRDPETAMFMLNNPSLHNALATLAEISNDEWDILTSGRFDGFLRSGADENSQVFPEPSPPSRSYPFNKSYSRGPTPAQQSQLPQRMSGVFTHSRHSSYPSRGPTPATNLSSQTGTGSHGAPVALDEETELATLAEIERDIYSGMEALEDAFEALHGRAEVVRQAIRERSAGLASAAQRRRGSAFGGPEIRGGTPASLNGYVNGSYDVGSTSNTPAIGGAERWETSTDDGLGDWEGNSELAPDDSASNISTSRRRRPKRRHERRTPVAVLDEEDENDDHDSGGGGGDGSDGTASPKR